MNAARPARFMFTLRDDYEFNYEVVVDIMYLEGNRPTLHVVDTATSFNAARFRSNITSGTSGRPCASAGSTYTKDRLTGSLPTPAPHSVR
jgi:hypothetical protein